MYTIIEKCTRLTHLDACILWRSVVTSPVLQGAVSPRLTASSSCWDQQRAAVEALLQGGLGLKQGTQSFGAWRLLLREEVHGATPGQIWASSRSPEGHILTALQPPPSTITTAFWHLKATTDFYGQCCCFNGFHISYLWWKKGKKKMDYLKFILHFFNTPYISTALVTVWTNVLTVLLTMTLGIGWGFVSSKSEWNCLRANIVSLKHGEAGKTQACSVSFSSVYVNVHIQYILQNLLLHQLRHRLLVPAGGSWHDPWPLMNPWKTPQGLGPPQAKSLHSSNSS